MQVTEIFYSLQGEGLFLGIPAVFLRLNGCNLRCKWCDTKYALDPKNARQMTIDEITKIIKKYPAKHLVITGGEPLLQQKEILSLIKKLKNYYIEVETNGTIKSTLDNYVDLYSCSPKLAHAKTLNLPLQKFPGKKTFYKFVIEHPANIEEVKNFIRKYKIKKSRVLLMPLGTKEKELKERSKWLAELCKKEDLRFSPRLQITLWGTTRAR
ncbi:hypothetical protein A3B60_02275 [Candidatus Peregrinibacteria bacterium RIFCSPLOWO2_01_FULL_39_12]|nr:MAG: hypothetical protein A3B60_02275 [Candidatus Peregrinibacteria bacterium RIFCSPLOWO2_01_FULL_39_12]OGJ43636.1 MAG: hypothetical protein A3I58_02985 [Candidatus Peregrinibacteria bacterium RIFCSPLOWO2_02_FULL_39_10]